MIDARRLSYKPGWEFRFGGPEGRYLCVFATTMDSQDWSSTRCTQHMFEMPPEGFDDDHAAALWVIDRLLEAERHEACEFFKVDGRAPFFPNHQNEGPPYAFVDRWEAQHASN